MRNGFQDPDTDTPDGGTLRKMKRGNVDIGRLGDILGTRVSFKPVVWENKAFALSYHNRKKNRISFGKFDWIQFFTAGTITKNISFFNELEFENTDDSLKHGWFSLGVHNIFGSKLVNVQVGKLSPVEWTSFSNRLRIFPEVKGLVDKVTVSANAASGEDSTDISSGQFGVNYYGYFGPAIWTVGFGNSKSFSDANQFKNIWSSLRLEITNEESPFAGSSASLFGYAGTDTGFTTTDQRSNEYYRVQPSLNIRWKDWDIIGSYHHAEEGNFRLSRADNSETYRGSTFIVSRLFNSNFQLGGQYDYIKQEFRNLGNPDIENKRFLTHASYLVRENFNVILTGILDMQEDSDDDKHSVFMTIRSMF